MIELRTADVHIYYSTTSKLAPAPVWNVTHVADRAELLEALAAMGVAETRVRQAERDRMYGGENTGRYVLGARYENGAQVTSEMYHHHVQWAPVQEPATMITLTVTMTKRYQGRRAAVHGPNGFHAVIHQTGGTLWSNNTVTGGTWAARSRPGMPHLPQRYSISAAAEDVAAAHGMPRGALVVNMRYPHL
ncbi:MULTISPECIES: hypothetical protein [Streptosporangium]|uniref:Uncharacterized protein n=1 Tax=Streptosporangium brasiliense TaxID=47480 RepID=A0ABT9RM55_9ACTN|nr:hypothetical protein [Streptosporangium brasiliense]MDP9870376.1 hypothetical protein [Streptosporangium brasiliense]